jgi:UDP-N-acetylglucosamine 2-epimerase (non-hydrolysing)
VKIVTVLGTRPEIIRLSVIAAQLDRLVEHVVVNTGQNFDPNLSGIFFEELGFRKPNYNLGVRGETFADQVGQILRGCEKVFQEERPDRLLILGDTNSALCAIIAKRVGIPVYHMEAGNRCYDDRVPEETNRRLIDHSSDVLMPYTERSRANLLQEGISSTRIFVTGNPILEVIEHYRPKIKASKIHQTLGIAPQNYFLVTVHRAENVDIEPRLQGMASAFAELARRYKMPVIVSTHPRTRLRLGSFGISDLGADVRFPDPFGFFDFLSLEKNARCALSDSGTVQEECAILGVPNVTLRDVTERPETIECGSNILTGGSPEQILAGVEVALSRAPSWKAPAEYLVPNVSDTVVRLVTSYNHYLKPYFAAPVPKT